jgi:hypothetical protein
MAETIYNVAKAGLMNGSIDLDTDDIRCLLLVGSVTISPDHATVAAVIAANTEATDGSYARQALTSEAVVQNDTNDRGEFDSATIDFGALDATTPTAALIYKFVTNDAGSTPISIHDTGFGTAANGAGYTITTPNDILRLS